jgi:hypothetical protein
MSVSVLPSTGGMASSSNSPARPGPAPAVAAVSQAGPVTSPLVPTTSVTAASPKHVAGRPVLHAGMLRFQLLNTYDLLLEVSSFTPIKSSY